MKGKAEILKGGRKAKGSKRIKTMEEK